ncbi:uncharacterized protein LOC127770907 [Oryza glaberrima]|uniref:uncharacterized protein LOC127770907 n=1 Tax=Oryza glaberrima TaxID=4538 RepID=UPI00224C417F|nr:uncharacterized protein LOC127770907 [Oryza glaberrima]
MWKLRGFFAKRHALAQNPSRLRRIPSSLVSPSPSLATAAVSAFPSRRHLCFAPSPSSSASSRASAVVAAASAVAVSERLHLLLPPRFAVVAERGLRGGRGESDEANTPLLFPSRLSFACEELCLAAIVIVVTCSRRRQLAGLAARRTWWPMVAPPPTSSARGSSIDHLLLGAIPFPKTFFC